MRIVTKIEPRVDYFKQTRVAIYCRVSSTHDAQTGSLENQIAYFEDMIRRRPDWRLVHTYADRRSGKNINGRPEFKRLLDADC